MATELQTYLIGLIPGMTLIATAIPIVIQCFSWIRKITRQDKDLANQVAILNDRLDSVLADNSALRKELLIQKRENRRIMSKVQQVYIPEEKEE